MIHLCNIDLMPVTSITIYNKGADPFIAIAEYLCTVQRAYFHLPRENLCVSVCVSLKLHSIYGNDGERIIIQRQQKDGRSVARASSYEHIFSAYFISCRLHFMHFA